jgi:hypothetical protein
MYGGEAHLSKKIPFLAFASEGFIFFDMATVENEIRKPVRNPYRNLWEWFSL